FLDDARRLGMKVAFEYPQQILHATEQIELMQKMIARLIERDHAYVGSDGVVYYSVETFPGYGRLSGNTLDQLQSGAGGRVSDENQAVKRHPADFMLWKPEIGRASCRERGEVAVGGGSVKREVEHRAS